MDAQTSHHAPTFTLMSIIMSVLSWVTLIDAQYILSFILTVLGIISAIFAIRFYYYAGNERRNAIKEKNN